MIFINESYYLEYKAKNWRLFRVTAKTTKMIAWYSSLSGACKDIAEKLCAENLVEKYTLLEVIEAINNLAKELENDHRYD